MSEACLKDVVLFLVADGVIYVIQLIMSITTES